MAASAVEPRGVVAVYFWGCRPQPPPRPPWVTLSSPPLFVAPAARRASLPRRRHRRRRRRCLHGTRSLWWGVGFSKRWGKISLLSLTTLFLSSSRHRAARTTSRRTDVPDNTPADDDPRTTRASRCLPDSVVVAPDDGGLAGCSGGDELPEMNLGAASHRAA